MGKYGVHPTIYGNLSDGELYELYRGESWFSMDEQHRQQLLQETVNRSAKLNGEIGACKVEFSDELAPNVHGEQSGDTIRLNRQHFVDDIVMGEYNGHVFVSPATHSNIQALETVLHEDIHAWQNQCIDGTIECPDPELLKEYMANNFDMAVVQLEDGTVDMGQQYLSGTGDGGYYLYYLQSTERDAHRICEIRTMEIVEKLAQKHGNETSFDYYRSDVKTNGFEATVAQANRHFVSDTVEADINTTLKNHYYNTKEPVQSPAVEEAVKRYMIQSLE